MVTWTPELRAGLEYRLGFHAPGTASAYTSCLQCLTGVDLYDEVAIDDLHRSLTRKKAANWRAAVRQLNGLLVENGLPPMVVPEPLARVGRAKATPWPWHQQDLIYTFLTSLIGASVVQVSRAHWGDWIVDPPYHHLVTDRMVPLSPKAVRALDEFRFWVAEDGNPDPTSPLIPVRPGSRVAATPGLLRQIIAETKA